MKPAKGHDFVFVYGSLRRGFGNHYLLDGAPLITEGTMPGQMFDLGPFPGLVHGPRRIKGEIYEIPTTYLNNLDTFECVPWLYHREQVCVDVAGESRPVSAWVYFYAQEIGQAKEIVSGDWREHASNLS